MRRATATTIPGLAALLAVGLSAGLGGCNSLSPTATGSISGGKSLLFVSDEERDCLGRAMYFEAKRSDEESLLAVGTVVMNRAESAASPSAASPGTRICEVVGRPGQFATGVLTKPMRQKDLEKVADVTDAVLAGERHPKVGGALYFHTAGRHYPYTNMHYVAVIGGNAFYEKRKPGEARPGDFRPGEAVAGMVREVTRTAALFLPPPGEAAGVGDRGTTPY